MKNFFNRSSGSLIMLALLPFAMAGCDREPAVSYSGDVKPIIDQNCVECHQSGGEGQQTSGFDMTTYDSLMKGTQFGPMIIAGDVLSSNMVVLMEGRADPSISMPHGDRKPISKQDIETIRLWIEQGAKNN